ncbi:MAG: isochorismatase family protein [Thermodesulfobacteriota bacterium]
MTRRLLKPRQCCVQIIDPQASLMNHIHEADRVVQAMGQVIECAGVLNLPVFGNTQYKKGLGPYVEEIEKKMAGVACFDKTSFSALGSEETGKFLTSLPETVSTVILAGVETHICVYQTAMSLLDMGLTPWVVGDGVSSRSPLNHELGLRRLEQAGCIVGPAEMIIYELLGRAGTAEFKAMLPHIL